ncbi:hypothetical protein BGZ65_009529 [Modicella reniformis]|uniref:Myb-like domain-containing protein n=1 Tax=Modicella reniformis TaxID=1440133 RepID=A0A9P6ME52_9FUNG|nr:hypothetical protein BGZ65_009529 [Modicella reniformis]
MARVRETHPSQPTAEAAKENLRQLSQRIHLRRTRARETILYDLQQGVKTMEAQVHKQVEMVLSKFKDTPGSKYAFALTYSLLNQLPNALSNTILPSAISAVADTVAGRTTNSLTTLRGRAGLDDEDEDEEEDEEVDDFLDDLDDPEDLEELSHRQQMTLLMRLRQQQNLRVSQQLSSEFGTIDLASPSPSSSSSSYCSSSLSDNNSSVPSSPTCPSFVSNNHESSYNSNTGGVTISRAGASELLAAYIHHNYSTAASQVLSAALPSFIPSMVAPIAGVFSYPTPPTSKTSSSNQSISSSSSAIMSKSAVQDDTFVTIKQEEKEEKPPLRAIKADPGISVITSRSWTTAECEALYVAATRFKLRGQWAKIRQVMGLHRTDKDIEREYQRLYGESDEVDDEDNHLVSIKKESDIEDYGDADDELEGAANFGDHSHQSSSTMCTTTNLSASAAAAAAAARPFFCPDGYPSITNASSHDDDDGGDKEPPINNSDGDSPTPPSPIFSSSQSPQSLSSSIGT